MPVIAGTAGLASEPPGNTLDQGRLIHFEQDHRIKMQVHLGKQGIQSLGLRHGARKAIKDKAALTILMAQPVLQHADDDVVRYQIARRHDSLGFPPYGGAGIHLGAQHIARRDLCYVIMLLQNLGLCSLARSWWTQQYDLHRPRPFPRPLRINPSY